MNKYLSSPFLTSEKIATVKIQFLPSAIATVATFATVGQKAVDFVEYQQLSVATVASVAVAASENQKKTLTSPSYAEVGKSLFGGNSDFLPQLNKINQLSFFDSFNCVAKVAVTGNNLKQELRNLLKTVSHRTLADVFLCLSFSNLPILGKLCFALALVRFWQGGRGNKPLGANTVCRLFLAVSNLLAALPLGRIFKTSLPFEKV